MYFTAKSVVLALCLLTMPTLAGCNTTAGFGRDVQSTGRWIEGGAKDTQAWMFGSPAQAAETNTAAVSPAMTHAMTSAAGGNVVYFASGSAEIPSDGLQTIRTIANDSKQSARRVEVTGYTDTTGSADYNERLSQRRAEAVAAELEAGGLPRKSIDVEWHGEGQLPVPTADGVAEPQNRRVTIAM